MLENKIYRFKNFLKGKEWYYRYDIDPPKISIGNPGCAWVISTQNIDSGSIVYSFGAGLDISFDTGISEMFGLRVHLFDPTPKSIEFVRSQNYGSGIVFEEVGIAHFSGKTDFFLPINPDHVSATMGKREEEQEKVEVQVMRLIDIMHKNGHAHLDVLKMDVEGAEYKVIDDILNSGILIYQLLVEFHHRFPENSIRDTRNAVMKLRKAGFGLFNVSDSGEEFSFMNLNFFK